MLYLRKQDHQAIPICLKLEIYHLLTKTSFYAIAGHYVLHSKTDVELRCTHIYVYAYVSSATNYHLHTLAVFGVAPACK